MNHPNPSENTAMMVGCAGWSIASKDAASFPSDGTHLERYARVFSCVEINTSFYRSHQQKTYARWARNVPDAFRFSVKMPRTITHELRLRQVETPLEAFLEEISALGEKLGAILIQLPPSLALDVDVARVFFDDLRQRTDAAIACEPRHPSWFTAAASGLFGDAHVSRVSADPSPVVGGQRDTDSNAEPLYIRLHGTPRIYYSAYDNAFLQTIAGRLREARAQGRQAWCIFDNTAQGEAVPNALTLRTYL